MFPELNNSNFEELIFNHYNKISHKYDSLISSGNRCVFDKKSKKYYSSTIICSSIYE